MTNKELREPAWYEKRLRGLLKDLPDPPTNSVDWERIEQTVFDDRPAVSRKRLPVWSRRISSLVRTPVWGLPLAAAAVIVLVVIGRALFQSPPHDSGTAQLVALHGQVTQREGGKPNGWRPAATAERFREGTVFKTGEQGAIVGSLAMGSGFSLSANSQMSVGRQSAGETQLRLDRGILTVERIAVSHRRAVIVSTPSARIVALGTLFRVAVADANANATTISLIHGALRVRTEVGAPRERTVTAPAEIVIAADSIAVTPILASAEAVQGMLDTLETLPLSASKPSGWPTDFFLVCSSPSQAKVMIDGEPVGETPVVVEQSVGKHRVSMDREGFAHYEHEFDLSSGVSRTLLAALSPLDASTAAPDRGTGPSRYDTLKSARPDSTLPKDSMVSAAPGIDKPVRPDSTELPGLPKAAPRAQQSTTIGVDRYHIAGELLGKKFYWETRNMRLDTLDWEKCAGAAGLRDDAAIPVLEQMQSANSQGKQFYELKTGSALCAALLNNLGYHIMVLSQWSGNIHDDRADQRSMIEQENTMTDFIWESVDRVRVRRVSSVSLDFAVDIYFADNGFGTFTGSQNLSLSRTQILGTTGFSLADKAKDLIPEANQYRLILKVFLVSDSSQKSQVIMDNLGRTMDSLKLDLSYKVPELRPMAP